MKIEDVIPIAHRIKSDLAPYCERIEIAGSIRRLKPEVKDIELICVPKYWQAKNLFGDIVQADLLTNNFLYFDQQGKILKNGQRYKQIELHEGINLDLFIVKPPAQWGVQFVIRTGPWEFSKRMVTQRYKKGYLPDHAVVHDGAVYIGHNQIVEMPEEFDFFDFCGMDWIFPELRR